MGGSYVPGQMIFPACTVGALGALILLLRLVQVDDAVALEVATEEKRLVADVALIPFAVIGGVIATVVVEGGARLANLPAVRVLAHEYAAGAACPCPGRDAAAAAAAGSGDGTRGRERMALGDRVTRGVCLIEPVADITPVGCREAAIVDGQSLWCCWESVLGPEHGAWARVRATV